MGKLNSRQYQCKPITQKQVCQYQYLHITSGFGEIQRFCRQNCKYTNQLQDVQLIVFSQSSIHNYIPRRNIEKRHCRMDNIMCVSLSVYSKCLVNFEIAPNLRGISFHVMLCVFLYLYLKQDKVHSDV